MKEIKPLTSLRAFAAFLVFMFHYAHVYRPENLGIPFGDEWIPLMPLWRQGQVGVSIFFVLSGFLITGILFDNRGRAGYFSAFYGRRLVRIFPLYYVTLAVIAGGAVMFASPSSATATVTSISIRSGSKPDG